MQVLQALSVGSYQSQMKKKLSGQGGAGRRSYRYCFYASKFDCNFVYFVVSLPICPFLGGESICKSSMFLMDVTKPKVTSS